MKRVFSIFFIFVVAGLLTAFCRFFLYSIATIPEKGQTPTLLQGDRVLIDLRSYGWLPFTQKRRWSRQEVPKRDDWVAFHSPLVERNARPDTSALFIGQIIGIPGDTIWMGKNGRIANHRSYSSGCVWPLLIPAKGMHVKLNAWNMALYQQMINRHELNTAFVSDGAFFVNENYSEHYQFHRDYYWISSGRKENILDSRTFGLVPIEFFVGKVHTVLYSFDPEKPMWRSWRRKRTLCSID